ncbi:hypothetical protein OE88DRAFT_1724140 [Heliocybe sulcata]|uniref:Uncharacterized protein n=1 Tax=Heliocybe sulcata TaxID=5364 RepID=A0A5C3NA32_9AGAM|nr:hypothetical protein OE88DRAFT_1724140 [Heliocybe sulcata]
MLSARPISIHTDGHSQPPGKTPGRTLTKGRNALQENAIHRTALPATTKARKVGTSHTPFHTKSTKHQATGKATGKTILSNLTKTASKPLLDKTPFPNRTGYNLRTPNAEVDKIADKIAKLSFLEPELELPGSSQVVNPRPSSTRKSLRLPRPSGSATSNKFRTPQTTGNHWDVSDGEVEVQGANEQAEKDAVEVEDDDEIEYMPPTAIIPPYEPPFEMPDYKELGKALMNAAFSHPYDDRPPPELDMSVYDEKFFASMDASLELELPELEDDNPFLPAPTPALIRESTSSTASTTPPVRTTRSITRSTSAGVASTTARSAPPTRPTTRATTRSVTTQATTSAARPATTAKPVASRARPASAASTRPTTRSTPRPATAASTRAATKSTPAVRVGMTASAVPRRMTGKAAATERSEPVALNDVEVLLVFDGQELGGLDDDDFRFDV